MTPEDIIIAVHLSGATITTDGMRVFLDPGHLVQQMVKDAIPPAKPALIGHLIDTGRLHGPDGQEAARLATRLTTGLELLWTLEQRGQMDTQEHRLFERLLAEYEGVAACGTAVAA